MKITLSPKQIQDFYELGFFVVPQLFYHDEIEDIKQCFDRLQNIALKLKTTQEHMGSQFVVDNNRIDRIVWMGGAEPNLLKYAEDARILSTCCQILKSKSLEQLICQGHYKLPGDNVSFDWHQDCQHRGAGSTDWIDIDGKGSYVQTLMAIDEITYENGPVNFIPNTTKLGYIELDKKNNLTDFFDIKTAIPLLMQPGDVAFFNPYVIHGSQPNKSNGPRRVFINGFAYPGANQKIYPGNGSGRTLVHEY